MGGDLLTHLRLLDDLAQLLNLILILFEKGILRILIHSRLVLDVLGAGCVSERRQSFLVIVISW